MYVLVYSIVFITIGCGLFFSIRLAFNSAAARYVRIIYCPAYCENEAEAELRRLLRLYPNALLRVGSDTDAVHTASRLPRIQLI